MCTEQRGSGCQVPKEVEPKKMTSEKYYILAYSGEKNEKYFFAIRHIDIMNQVTEI